MDSGSVTIVCISIGGLNSRRALAATGFSPLVACVVGDLEAACPIGRVLEKLLRAASGSLRDYQNAVKIIRWSVWLLGRSRVVWVITTGVGP